MKKLFMLIVCLILISFASSIIPVQIPGSAIRKERLQAQLDIKAECIYTGITDYPPWLAGRDAPWDSDVRIDDVFGNDDQLISMAEDANGRIYVCYETTIADGRYGWGLATSVDNGQTWDNRVYSAGAPRDCRFPEIAITSDGKIWIWGTRRTAASNDDVYWLKSIDGSFNDPDQLDGFWWFGLGLVDGRTYPEVTTWGNSSQLILSTWTYDDGTENVVSWIYATDGGAGGSWNIYSLSPDGEPEGMTSIGANFDGANYIAIHGWEEDIGGGDWNVLCMIDTLDVSTGLSGWGTTNTNPDRYPSVFCSGGYAYIAYQGNVGSPNFDDILFNYSTDYGVNWLASMIDLTNSPASETYPRLYGNSSIIGVDYVYAANRVRFDYSLDNGQNWLSSPETVDDNSTVNGIYHSAALLHTTTYWYAAWEDSRNSGTDGLEVYTSRRVAGQGNITHRPAILTFNYNFAFLGGLGAEKYVIRHSVQPIDEKLSQVMRESSPDAFIPIFIMLTKQMNPEYLLPRAEQMSKPERRQFVINECITLANADQKELLSYLRQKEMKGKVSDIISQWTTNTICLKAKPQVINQIAQRIDVWEIGYAEPLQIIGVEKTVEPIYKHVEFIPENGREICWGVAKINADQVWGLGYTGAGIVVGHMDSGVNYNHNDLNDHMWTNTGEIRGNGIDDDGNGYIDDYYGYDFVSDDSLPMDEDDHGTQTAGVVAGDGTSGSNTGVAPDAEVMALRIYPGTSSEMGEAIAYALNNGADLLSCSIGWPNPVNAIKNWCRGQSITIYAAGIVWCNAAGNGNGVGGHYAVPQDINSPADCPAPWYAPNGGNTASIAVGATNSGDVVASWSSYGPTHWNTGSYTDYPYPPGLMKPDVAAPGVSIKSLDRLTNNGYDTGLNGTSFAQPHHAGTVALMLDRNPALTPRQVDSIIQETAVDIESAGRDNLSGAGRIDALAAINFVSPGAKWAQLWVINQASATGILDVTDITQDEAQPWIISISPKQFTVPINDSEDVWVTVDTTGQGLTWGNTYYDTLLIWSNSTDANPDSVPVILIMATIGIEENEDITRAGNTQFLSMVPNPFTRSVKIDYAVSHSQNVQLTVYDVCGKKVRTLINKNHKPGNFSLIWDGKDDYGRKLAAGVYFSRIEAENSALTNKVILVK